MSFLLRRFAYYSCIATILLRFGLLGQLGANGQLYNLYGQKKLATHTITVDQSGKGNFTKIQSAIDAVPSNNKDWVCIKISAGTYRFIYFHSSSSFFFFFVVMKVNQFVSNLRIELNWCREKVKIPFDKPYILLKGENKRRTQIVWDDIGPVDQSATFISAAPSITVKSITFAVRFLSVFFN